MGCPDWPMCYGGLMPPMSETSLPLDYKEVFVAKRLVKVERFASLLDRLGFAAQARNLREHPLIDAPEHFDPVKAWIEYVNRVFGVLAGLFAIRFLYIAIRNGDLRRHLPWVLLGFAFLLINGWLGAVVVATNLIPGIVSLHFMLAFVCLFAYMLALHRESPFSWTTRSASRSCVAWSWIIWLGIWGIVTLGTWAREGVEGLRIAGKLGVEQLNVEAMGSGFVMHRYLPLVLLAVSFWQTVSLSRSKVWSLRDPWMTICLISLLQVILGAVHIAFVVPVWAQLTHVVLGSGLLVAVFAWALSESARSKSHDARVSTT